MPKEIQILLVDDHAIVRQGLRALLEAEVNFKVVDEAGNGLDALEKVKKSQTRCGNY
ncbi:MAG: response regulator transcription factor [Blastocatellia bacterium]|nr:response regulator transcription factor [Blastocatellia bacterium]